jgi:hypothetical protein
MMKYRDRLVGSARHVVVLIDPNNVERSGTVGGARAVAQDGRPPHGDARRRGRHQGRRGTGKRRSRPYRPRRTKDECRRIFAAINDPRVDPRICLAIELAAECRTGQVLQCTRRALTLPGDTPNDYNAAPPSSLGQIEIPGAGKKHGEVVVLTPEQRRAVDDALAGYLANYEVAWRAGEIDDYYLFPGSKMRMLDETGRRWTRRVRAGVKPFSRDGARVAFKELKAIAKVEHVEGRGWYGLRRIPPVRGSAGGRIDYVGAGRERTPGTDIRAQSAEMKTPRLTLRRQTGRTDWARFELAVRFHVHTLSRRSR